MTDDSDIKITPLQSAYLKAFDNWLHTTWKTHANPEQVDNAATGLKDACFAELMKEHEGTGRVLICLRCGTEPVAQHKRQGRPRRYCIPCTGSRTTTLDPYEPALAYAA